MNKNLQHIMHITYDMRIGGTEMVIKNIIEGCEPGKCIMSVLCIESPLGPFAEELLQQGIEFIELNRKPGFDTYLINQIRQTIKEKRVDIIHCHQYTPWVYGVFAAMFTNTKVIFTEHGRFYPDSSSWKRKLINPILNKFTDQVTAISKATKEALVEYENISAKNIKVIYNGIIPLQTDIIKVNDLRKKLNIPEDHTVLGTVSRFDPIKNHTMMLSAFAEVLKEQPKCTLLVVGDGEERKNIECRIAELKIEKHIILTGYEPKPAEHIELMDIFLLSSLSEGTSMTLLEAMSIGKPCVVTDVGGNPEVIENKKAGFVVPNDDFIAFSNAILECISSTTISEELSLTAKSNFKASFSNKIMARNYNRVYQNLC